MMILRGRILRPPSADQLKVIPMAKKSQTNQTQVAESAQQKELYVISEYLKTLKFSPRVMGVDEADVWKKIEKLCELYDNALASERGKNEKLTRLARAYAMKLKEYQDAEKSAEEDQPDG